jgi:hypothetical protein
LVSFATDLYGCDLSPPVADPPRKFIAATAHRSLLTSQWPIRHTLSALAKGQRIIEKADLFAGSLNIDFIISFMRPTARASSSEEILRCARDTGRK